MALLNIVLDSLIFLTTNDLDHVGTMVSFLHNCSREARALGVSRMGQSVQHIVMTFLGNLDDCDELWLC